MGSSLQRGQERWFRVRSNISLRDQSLNPQPEKLKGSKLDTPENLATFSQKFDEGLKMVFADDQATQYVKFASPMDNDYEHGVMAGRLLLTG